MVVSRREGDVGELLNTKS